jgi:hypothetical protein
LSTTTLFGVGYCLETISENGHANHLLISAMIELVVVAALQKNEWVGGSETGSR